MAARSQWFNVGAALLVSVVATAEGAEGEFRDDFADGSPKLSWRSHSWSGDAVVEGRAVDDAPDGDGGIGVLRHRGEGPGTVSYAETLKAGDAFGLAARVYCPLEAAGRDGTMTGLAFFIDRGRNDDPEAGGFYRFVCDYRFGVPSVSYAYVGADIRRQPLELERWTLIGQPVPADGNDGWQWFEVRVEQGLVDLYLNGEKLNQRPLPAEHVITDIAEVEAGYAGVYADHIGEAATAEARIDDFVYRVP